ncbi:MAG: DUF192 domain-containing protein [Bdellovibrio sp.]|jgi:uncharacterized membrane protein (UPF0127 family)
MKLHLALLLVVFVFNPMLPAAKADERKIVMFKTQKIEVANVPLLVEVADTPQRLARGLMFRTSLGEGKGMLFIFENEEIRGFWMKNTFVPLSIGFFDRNKKLLEIQDMEPVKSEMELNPPSYTSNAPAMYALEVPRGWFQKHKIKIGDPLTGL